MCKIQFDSDVKAMKIKLNGSGWFPQVTSFYLPLIGHNLLLVYYRFIKVTFTNAAFITLGAKCYYRKDLYYAWFQNLITDGTFITLAWVKINVITNETFVTLGSSYYTCTFYTGKIGSLEMEMSQ